jgi:hypothetical protein
MTFACFFLGEYANMPNECFFFYILWGWLPLIGSFGIIPGSVWKLKIALELFSLL